MPEPTITGAVALYSDPDVARRVDVYLAGYSAQKVQTLAKRAEELNALVIDVRGTFSSPEEWDRSKLAASLPCRYLSIGSAWGGGLLNGRLYVNDFRYGMRIMENRLDSFDSAIILCACRAESECHRGLIGKLLAEQGYKVRPLVWRPKVQAVPPLVPDLFTF